MTMSAIALSATVVASMNLPPKIQSASAPTARSPITIWFREMRPIVPSSRPAQAGTSALSFTSGG